METALIAVKTLVEIDDDVFTEFSYSSSFSNFETREGLVWQFSWSDQGNAYIYATAAADGTLLNYGKYRFDRTGFGFAEISKQAAITIADEFIKRANEKTYTYYKAPVMVSTNLHNGNYNLFYTAEVNGHAFSAASVSINVDKFTGEVTGYSSRNINPGRFVFESATDLIDKNAAIAAYADKIGLSLEYRSFYDYENNKLTVFPVYMLNSGGDRFISAKSGDVVEYVYDLGIAGDNTSANDALYAAMDASAPEAASGGSGSRASLTPAERSAIEQMAGFITSEQALEKLLEAADLKDLDTGSFDQRNINLSRDYYARDRFFYDVNLYRQLDWTAAEDEISGLYGRVDAETGRVMVFYFYYHGVPYSDEAGVWSDERTEAAVDAFLKKMAPAELAKSGLEYKNPPGADRYGSRSGTYSFGYIRYENDTPFRDNGITVTFNQHTGKITHYSLNWFDDVVFPGLGNVLTPQRALTEFVNQYGVDVTYITVGNGNASLVYDFRSNGYIDPLTGKAIDYRGQLPTDATETPTYDDVAGHWSESYIKRLLENGVFLWGGKFEPNKVMTELEFLQYIMLVEQAYLARMDVQVFFTQRGVNVEASADKNVTRQEAARIIAEYLGYGKLAAQSEWFVYPFSDSVDPAYRGYITICYMLGIMGGDNGRFNASANVTRAHAAVMLHNLIIARS